MDDPLIAVCVMFILTYPQKSGGHLFHTPPEDLPGSSKKIEYVIFSILDFNYAFLTPQIDFLKYRSNVWYVLNFV